MTLVLDLSHTGLRSDEADASTPQPLVSVASLTARMARGEDDAFREFFARYFHRLLAYLVVVARGDEQHARELLQQTMIKVARHIRPFEEEAALWRWLTVLARTSAVDEGRKAKRYFSFLDRLWGGGPELPDNSPDELQELLNEQLSTLDPDDRAVIERKYITGCSVREIAVEFETTEKAIESRLTRVRAKLKNALKGLQ